MKIAVTSDGPTINDNIEERFLRWPYFLIIDTDTMESIAIKNQDIALGIGPQRAKSMACKGVSFLLTGNYGSTVIKIFEEAGIQVIPRMASRIMDVVEHFRTCINPFPGFKC
jgi:predicted Fe-Mo cluster-binding NifX family protein